MQSKYGMVKTFHTSEGDEIKLVFNAMTFVIYMNYTGRDLMNDFTKLAISQTQNVQTLRPGLIEEVGRGDFSNVTEEEMSQLAKMNTQESNQFLIDFIAALIATASYPQRIDYCDVIMCIPIEMLYDKDFSAELLELLKFGLVPNDVKKKAQI
nr:MAG TPA: hypothetical protein [Bacteriophage sp.]